MPPSAEAPAAEPTGGEAPPPATSPAEPPPDAAAAAAAAAEAEARWLERTAERKKALAAVRESEKKALKTGAAESHRTRLAFLMKQADIFSHFGRDVPEAAAGASVAEQPSVARAASTASASSDGGKRTRGRVSEKAEDAALLQQSEEAGGAAASRLLRQPPCVVNGEMRTYQLEGLNWMLRLHENGINGILADEMGLGKTLQTISLLGYLKQSRGVNGPHLVITPKSTLSNWVSVTTS